MKALSERERRVMTRHYARNETFRGIGEQESVGAAYIGQIVNRSIRKLRYYFMPERLDPPASIQTARCSPSPGFDKQAFLRHMQGLIARRDAETQNVFERERAELDWMLAREAGEAEPPKPYITPVYVPPKPLPHVPTASPGQTVEPWFNLSRQPTVGDMRCIAQYALGYLGAIRPQCSPAALWPPPVMGTNAAHAICARDADAIANALQSLSRAIPPAARLSGKELGVPEGLLGASLSTAVGAMRVVSMAEGQQVSIEVTYD